MLYSIICVLHFNTIGPLEWINRPLGTFPSPDTPLKRNAKSIKVIICQEQETFNTGSDGQCKKLTTHCCCSHAILAYHCYLIFPSWIILSRQDKKTECFFFGGGGGGSSYMVLQIVKGRSQKNHFILFYIHFILYIEIVIKNPGSGIQMVGKSEMLADNPKCRAWSSAG